MLDPGLGGNNLEDDGSKVNHILIEKTITNTIKMNSNKFETNFSQESSEVLTVYCHLEISLERTVK